MLAPSEPPQHSASPIEVMNQRPVTSRSPTADHDRSGGSLRRDHCKPQDRVPSPSRCLGSLMICPSSPWPLPIPRSSTPSFPLPSPPPRFCGDGKEGVRSKTLESHGRDLSQGRSPGFRVQLCVTLTSHLPSLNL